MLIWIILFIIIIMVSLFLAWRSMKDYRERPSNFTEAYSVFLIQHQHNLTPEIIERLHSSLVPQQLIMSFERLFKGNKLALVVYGPISVLEPFKQSLGLLELEDYTKKVDANAHIVAWEMGLRSSTSESTFQAQKVDLPPLHDFEQLWWQVVIQPKHDANNPVKLFHSTIRVVVSSQSMRRSEELQHSIARLWLPSGLMLVPQPLAPGQLLNFYKDRALSGSPLVKTDTQIELKPEDILGLLHFVA